MPEKHVREHAQFVISGTLLNVFHLLIAFTYLFSQCSDFSVERKIKA